MLGGDGLKAVPGWCDGLTAGRAGDGLGDAPLAPAVTVGATASAERDGATLGGSEAQAPATRARTTRAGTHRRFVSRVIPSSSPYRVVPTIVGAGDEHGRARVKESSLATSAKHAAIHGNVEATAVTARAAARPRDVGSLGMP
jgi:hypothetical protein